MTDKPRERAIRSFVLRTGRMTPGQERAYERHWAEWGLEHASGPLNIDAAFGRSGERVLKSDSAWVTHYSRWPRRRLT